MKLPPYCCAGLQHALQQAVLGVDEVVAEQHRERLVADVLLRAEHRVAEALGVALPDVVHGGQLVGLPDELEPLGVALGGQRFLKLVVPVEVVFDGPLAPAGDQQHIVQPGVTASSTTYWMAGLSTTGNISLGVALVAGRNRVPRPAAGTTALVTAALSGILVP